MTDPCFIHELPWWWRLLIRIAEPLLGLFAKGDVMDRIFFNDRGLMYARSRVACGSAC